MKRSERSKRSREAMVKYFADPEAHRLTLEAAKLAAQDQNNSMPKIMKPKEEFDWNKIWEKIKEIFVMTEGDMDEAEIIFDFVQTNTVPLKDWEELLNERDRWFKSASEWALKYDDSKHKLAAAEEKIKLLELEEKL